MEPLHLERPVAGGAVLGRQEDGRVVLVTGGLPGELVRVARATGGGRRPVAVSDVLEPSPSRVDPPCPHVARGCGGCDLQHAAVDAQLPMKVEVVRDALRHLAGMPDVPVEAGGAVDPEGYRTTMRFSTERGRLTLRPARSHRGIDVPGCLVAHPLLRPTIAEGRFPGATSVTVRASVAEESVVAVVDGPAHRAQAPEGVRVLGVGELSRSRKGSGSGAVVQHEDVAGHRLRVSPGSFFQSGPQAAALLGDAVATALGGHDPSQVRLVDLYGGIGLLTVLLGARRAVVVERSSSACADARVNTAELGARVVRTAVERWRPEEADVVVADPAREGLGTAGADAVAVTGAELVVLVSCDAASLGRDARLLAERGWALSSVRVLDLFPHTHHLEAVSTFGRVDGRP